MVLDFLGGMLLLYWRSDCLSDSHALAFGLVSILGQPLIKHEYSSLNSLIRYFNRSQALEHLKYCTCLLRDSAPISGRLLLGILNPGTPSNTDISRNALQIKNTSGNNLRCYGKLYSRCSKGAPLGSPSYDSAVRCPLPVITIPSALPFCQPGRSITS